MDNGSQVRSRDADSQLVMLIHGIRTRAPWYIAVRDALHSAGFKVELTNYGRFDLFRFLLPFPLFTKWAVTDVERDLRAAMTHHEVDRVSVIAHSFGIFIIAWILRHRDIKFGHIIFSGSVVKFRFPFEQYGNRFDGVVVNEVGTRDIWPILAASVTWGYGPTGAFGFNRPRVFDRYHRGLSHSAFLNADFCRSWWIPVFRGEEPQSNDEPETPPWWLRFLSVVHIKYVLIALVTLWGLSTWCRAPEREVHIPTADVYFAGGKIRELVAEAERPCSQWCPEFLRGQRCMRTTASEGAVETLVVRRTRTIHFAYHDPTAALETLASGAIACLEVEGEDDRALRVGVNKALASEMKTSDGKSLWLCGCDEEARRKVQEILTR